jgi:hypothetical protein
MAFKKGDKNINRTGRPKGAVNYAELRAFLGEFLEDNKEKFVVECRKLKGMAFTKVYLEAMQYTTPKMKQVEIKDVPPLEAFINMSPDERQEVYNKLKEGLKK